MSNKWISLVLNDCVLLIELLPTCHSSQNFVEIRVCTNTLLTMIWRLKVNIVITESVKQ